jgi:uncharacterized protein
MLANMGVTTPHASSQGDTELLSRIVERARDGTPNSDPTHDWLHVERVTETVRVLALAERADLMVAMAAALLHELVSLPKSDPQSHLAADLCATAARHVLASLSVPEALIDRVAVAIEEHPFSRGASPSSAESAVLQDADRLDAIGAIGIARCLATAGTIGRAFYSPEDPFCRDRQPDDRRWALDHFYRKLLRIPDQLNTATARRLAEPRVQTMRAWLLALEAEIGRGVSRPGAGSSAADPEPQTASVVE